MNKIIKFPNQLEQTRNNIDEIKKHVELTGEPFIFAVQKNRETSGFTEYQLDILESAKILENSNRIISVTRSEEGPVVIPFKKNSFKK